MNIKKLINRGFKYIVNKDYRFRINAAYGKYNDMPDEEYIKKQFKACMGNELNLENPKTFNEKLQWLKLNDRNPLYTIMADKYSVREYLKQNSMGGGTAYCVPLIDVWEKEEDIDFDKLPEKFVLKCNHNSGLGMCICKNKSKLNIEAVRKNLKSGLEQDYYLTSREWPYKDINRKIICEKFMEDGTFNNAMTDYRMYCFNGKPAFIHITSDTTNSEKELCYFVDLEWNSLEYRRKDESYYVEVPSKPSSLNDMIAFARKFAKDIPFVRCDFYEVGGKMYFSEFTFFPSGGYVPFVDHKYDIEIGRLLQLPISK